MNRRTMFLGSIGWESKHYSLMSVNVKLSIVTGYPNVEWKVVKTKIFHV